MFRITLMLKFLIVKGIALGHASYGDLTAGEDKV